MTIIKKLQLEEFDNSRTPLRDIVCFVPGENPDWSSIIILQWRWDHQPITFTRKGEEKVLQLHETIEVKDFAMACIDEAYWHWTTSYFLYLDKMDAFSVYCHLSKREYI